MTQSIQTYDGPNKDYQVNSVYHNRNPRNLEKMGLARKRIGWKLTAPRKDFYHKMIFRPTHRHTEARLEHANGLTVLTASTREWAVRDQLYSCTDVSASHNIGRVMAQRCLESGITEVFVDDSEINTSSEKAVSFLQALKENGISLSEPDVIEPKLMPGQNYDGYNRVAEPKIWQEDYQKE